MIALICKNSARSGETIHVARESLKGGTGSVLAEFPALFSKTLGTTTCPLVSDSIPVRSPPYRCAPPNVAIFRKIINELLEQGVIRPSKSPYASPAFLIPNSGGDFRMVMDYRKVNAKVVFGSYPMPTIDQACEQFGALYGSRSWT